jgi:hypothetical protein
MQKCKTDVRKNYATNAHGRPILESWAMHTKIPTKGGENKLIWN